MSNMKKCTNCGTENIAQFQFCKSCGTLLSAEVVSATYCANCGTQLDPTAKFCGGCGTPTEYPPVAPINAPIAVQQPKNKKNLWWILGGTFLAVCVIVGIVLALIGGGDETKKDVDVDDFIEAFENASYEMEYDYDETLSDFEEEYGVGTGIEKFAAYTGKRTHQQNGWAVEEDIYRFYYIKCDDEESASIVFDAIRDDEMYRNAETVRSRDDSEKVRSEGVGDTYVYNGEVNYAKRCNIVSREDNVVVFVEVGINDYYQYGIDYNYLVDRVLEDVGF